MFKLSRTLFTQLFIYTKEEDSCYDAPAGQQEEGASLTMGVDGANCIRDKILVLNELKKHNNNIQLVAERTGFDKETIKKWAQQKTKMQSAPNKAKKRRGGGGGAPGIGGGTRGGGGGMGGGGMRTASGGLSGPAAGTTVSPTTPSPTPAPTPAPSSKPTKPVYIMTVEEKLWECYNKYRDAGHYVNVSRLRDLTCQIIRENDLTDFEYSPGWLRQWMLTYKLVAHCDSSSDSSSPVGLSDTEEREARKRKTAEKEARKKERELQPDVFSSGDYVLRDDEVDAVNI